jgi:SAM-dependent methyltransferase
MDWRIKAVVQKALSWLPGGSVANDRLQQWAGNLKNFEANIDTKVINDWLVFMEHHRRLGQDAHGMTLLEIGTGWYPTLPFCYSLSGVALCHTFDISRHLNENLTRRMLARLKHHIPAIAARCGDPERVVAERWQRLQDAPTLPELLARANVVYHAPANAGATSLDAGSIDVVFSNSVLEHVHESYLPRLFAESRRLLRPLGVAIHSANCGDHYAYIDPRITPIHYLRFTRAQWRWWDNTLAHQNRLRPSDFLRMAQAAGMEVVFEIWKPRPDLLQRLAELPIAPEFRGYPAEELCCTSIDFAVRPAAPGGTAAGSGLGDR